MTSTNSFSNIPTSKTNVYVLGKTQMQIDKVALYLGRSYANDEDWFCMGKIFINDVEVFKCDKSSYAPELLPDDYVVSRALEYAFSRNAEQIIREYREAEVALKKLSPLSSIFKRKEVVELKKSFEKLEKEYKKIKAIRDNEPLFKLVRENGVSPSNANGSKAPSQPGEF